MKAPIIRGRKIRLAALLIGAAASMTLAQNGPNGAGASTPCTLSGKYTVSGKTAKLAGTTCDSDAQDVSAIYVKSLGALSMADVAVTSSGSTSSEDNSSFYGLNAAVLATRGSKIKIVAGSVSTTGTGGNGIFATGVGASIDVSKTIIRTTGDGAHGAMSSAGGMLTLADVTISTTGARAAAVATDRGGGTITVNKATLNTSGDRSPAIYSTGTIKITGGTMTAEGAEGAVVEGKNSLTLIDASLTGRKSRGVMLYQSSTGDSSSGRARFVMQGGSLTASEGPLFYVTNTTATVQLSNVNLTASEGKLVDASVGEWGRSGSNGGHLLLTAEHQTLPGSIVADANSSVAIKLQSGTTLNGSAKNAAVMLDASSTWNVSADSVVTSLVDASAISGNRVTNITGNGFDVHYDAGQPDNKYLGSKIYNLVSGGHLIPDNITAPQTNSNPSDNGNPNGNNFNNAGGGNRGGANGGNGNFGGGPGGGGGRHGR
jgi:hypothetical protein